MIFLGAREKRVFLLVLKQPRRYHLKEYSRFGVLKAAIYDIETPKL